ncbi:MAG: hypothetical protein OQK12_14960 [Motiliproteus sp.]|nr:hypothetical protein [Motiliproteus sp.]MCW9052507.1 hypothetical protein [Motiliproteus sp.]
MDMTEILSQAERLIGDVERPEHFTNHTHCCECQEHDETLLNYTPQTITRAALGGMGWDPITFATDIGFRYYLPGLVRIVLTETGDDSYYEQFLWHMLGDGEHYKRREICSVEERLLVARVLDHLLNNFSQEMDEECLSDDLLAAIEKWALMSEKDSVRNP